MKFIIIFTILVIATQTTNALPPPLGKFILSPLSNLTLYMRYCGKDAFATQNQKKQIRIQLWYGI